MTSAEQAELKDQYFEKVRKLAEYVWNQNIIRDDIQTWLNNFRGEFEDGLTEEICALHLLGCFMYFDLPQTRELLRSLFQDVFKYPCIEKIRLDNADTLDPEIINYQFDSVLRRTKFLGVGNPSESGALLLYYFRQVNGLSTNLFMNTHEIIDRSSGKARLRMGNAIDRYVFLDDLCGSGNQACGYSVDLLEDIRAINPKINLCYYPIFATQDGISKVRSQTQFDEVCALYELDDSFRAFGENSRAFVGDDNYLKDLSKTIMEGYGAQLVPAHPLGYENCQLLLGFFYNTPDNTLPVIWFDGKEKHRWRAAFERFAKYI